MDVGMGVVVELRVEVIGGGGSIRNGWMCVWKMGEVLGVCQEWPDVCAEVGGEVLEVCKKWVDV